MKNQKSKIKNQKFKITKKSKIQKIIEEYPKAMEVFLKYNLPCVGCAAAHFESLEAIAKEFDTSIDKLIKDLNKIAK